MRLIENALWLLPLHDHLALAYKDTMQDHGIQVNMLREVNLLENKLKIASGVLKRRLFARLLLLCECAAALQQFST